MNGSIDFQFVGLPCGRHGPYTFYKAFSYTRADAAVRILSQGEFFFVRISRLEVCVCELQLLWEEENAKICSCQFYFTPAEYESQRGEDEVMAMSEKSVLALEDLVSWIVDDVWWPKANAKLNPSPDIISSTFSHVENGNLAHKAEVKGDNSAGNKCDQVPSVTVLSYSRYCRYRAIQKRLESSSEREQWLDNNYVHVLGGFPPKIKPHLVLFCRDTVDRPDLEQHERFGAHLSNKNKSTVVTATVKRNLVRRKMPSLKGRPRKRRFKSIGGEKSPSIESNTSEETKEIRERNNNNRLMVKKNQLRNIDAKNAAVMREEEDFLEDLFAFMKDRKSPIERVPHLGFKQINLYLFYSYAQNLGGYERVTSKKLWKQIYDVLGGSPGSTSAATCTRRHYERLLLPYERHTKGEEYKPLPIPLRQKRPLSITKRQPSSSSPTPTPPPPTTHSVLIPEIHSHSDVSPTPTSGIFSVSSVASPTESSLASPEDRDDSSPHAPVADEDKKSDKELSLTPCDIRCDTPPATPPAAYEENRDLMTPCLKEEQWEERRRKSTHPKQRLKDENFAAKERQWDEIRRLNAIERDKVRHLSHTMRISQTQKKVKDGKHNVSELADVPLPSERTHEIQQLSIKNELEMPTPSGYSSALNSVYETSPSTCNSQPPLADLSRVVNALPNPPEPKPGSHSASKRGFTPPTVDKLGAKMDRDSSLIAPLEMTYPTPKIDNNKHAIDKLNTYTSSSSSLPYLSVNQDGDHKAKDATSRHYSSGHVSPHQSSVARPSVIQHTFSRSLPKKESIYGPPTVNLSRSSSTVASSASSSDHLPSPYYSHGYAHAHKKSRYEPHHTISSSQYYPAPKIFNDPQDSLLTAGPSSGICGRTLTPSHQPTTSAGYADDQVLDLSMKKPKPEAETKPAVHYIEDVAQYERITPPDRELDLSVKAKSTSAEAMTTPHSSAFYSTASFGSNERVLAPPIRTSGLKEYSYAESNGSLSPKSNRVDSLRTEEKLEKGAQNQSCLTVSCVPLVPKQPFYSHHQHHHHHQMTTPNYYTSSMYAFPSPFMVPPAPTYVSSDHLHASITAYKDMFHPNFYNNSYPYPPAPPLYHHLYKENQPSYLYPPK